MNECLWFCSSFSRLLWSFKFPFVAPSKFLGLFFSISVENIIEIVMETALNLWITLNNTDVVYRNTTDFYVDFTSCNFTEFVD